MPATLLSLRTDLRYRWHDTDEINPTIATVQYNSWINRAIRKIAAITQFIEAANSITPDGVNHSFTLIGTGSANLAADVLAVKGFRHVRGLVNGPIDINIIWQAEADGAIVAGDPTHYALWLGGVWFDAIPPVSLTIVGDYYGFPVDLVDATPSPSPPSPLHQFDGLILSAAEIEKAGDDGDPDMMARAQASFNIQLPPFIKIIEQKGKHQTLGNRIPYRRL